MDKVPLTFGIPVNRTVEKTGNEKSSPKVVLGCQARSLFFGSPALHLFLSIGGAALFACLLVYDTHLIMQRFSAEEYIAAAITLYLDIINLFLYILRILQAADSH
ncbi:unnamed protein product [Dibothriocephalus latus]|uniref:Uncharacterized protein n=1 Tax=Dibothriocephalus latus TaxID=60516 RepID=A0A3P6T140_DIBLA|nr:unnamed protein product [Dibothriocephalus latus]